MRSVLSKAASLAVCGLIASQASAAVVLSEDFNYNDGEITAVSAGAWALHSPAATPNAVVAQQLAIVGGKAFLNASDTLSRDDGNRALSQTFDPATDNTTGIYGSFVTNFSALPGGNPTTVTNGSYFAHLKSTTANEFYARIGATTDPTVTAGNFRLAIATEAWTTAASIEHPTELSLNTDYLVVFKLDLATDRATLWVNPVNEASTSVTSTDAPSFSGQIAQFALRQGTSGSTGWSGANTVDSIRIGTSFADVVPEPGTAGLLAVAAGAMGLRRRK